VVYENLYLSPWESQSKQVKRMFAFLGLSPIITKRMKTILTREPMTNQRDYFKIPNVYEIEKKFGSDETGWLFDGYGGLI